MQVLFPAADRDLNCLEMSFTEQICLYEEMFHYDEVSCLYAL